METKRMSPSTSPPEIAVNPWPTLMQKMTLPGQGVNIQWLRQAAAACSLAAEGFAAPMMRLQSSKVQSTKVREGSLTALFSCYAAEWCMCKDASTAVASR